MATRKGGKIIRRGRAASPRESGRLTLNDRSRSVDGKSGIDSASEGGDDSDLGEHDKRYVMQKALLVLV